ncbi:RNA polymerase sigma factor [Pararobbsia silviterrae]|uniref:RNA polymerase sigma factor n=1 Tax=Pararobbsia silviterrae TaxID=1792498 RepID=UPI001980CE33|nr:RNA polymerase sigma factor [Pararobbsia silviterrae]
MVARYYRELLNFISKTSKDRDAAADIVQESYARVLAAQQSGSTILEPRALLYRTARNLQIDAYRRSEARGDHAELADVEAAEPLALRAAPIFEPEVAASSNEHVQAILAAIGALPLRCREAFILHKFDGLPQAEVARRMGISPKTVEEHIRKAMTACRQCKDALDRASGLDGLDGRASPPSSSL